MSQEIFGGCVQPGSKPRLRFRLLAGVAMSALAVMTGADRAQATPKSWNVDADGNFNTAGDWTPTGVPTAADDATIATPSIHTITSSVGNTVNTLATGANSTLAITGGQFSINAGTGTGGNAGTISVGNNTILRLGSGTYANSGAISLNSAGNTTELRVGGGQTATLNGGGTVSLSNNPNNIIRDAETATGTLVNADNTIQGSGNIGNGQLHLDNQAAGTITANQATPLFLNPNGTGYTNEGVLQATNAGNLALLNGTFTQSGAGVTRAVGAGSVVSLSNSAVIGGTLTTSSGGAFATGGTNTLQNLTISSGSTFTGTNNTATYLSGTITNNGTIALSSAGNTTELRIPGASTTTLTGGGTVSLSNNASNLIRDADAASGTLVNVNNTIQGSGNIGNGQMALDNQAGGTITANQSTPLFLSPNGAGYTNEGVLQATSGGNLVLQGGSFTQSGGTTRAAGAGSVVSLVNAAVNGGTLTTASGGAFATSGVNSINNVTVSSGSTFTGSNNTITYLGGTITNQGTLLLNSGGNTTEFRIGAGSTTTLTGGGTVQLSNDPNNFIRDADAATGTLVNLNNTIQGSGQLGNGQLHVDNRAAGLIDANQSNALVLQSNGAGTSNAGTLRASAGGTLVLNASAVNQTANGVLLATGSGSRVLLQNGAAVNGGTLTTTSGGAFATAGVNSINSVTISSGSTFTGSNNTVTYLGGTITNQGTLLLNSGGNTTEFRIGAGSTTTLTGGGTVQLSNDPNNFIRDADAATGTLVNANNTIQGSGQLGFGQLHVDNRAAGLIDANQSNALVLQSNGAGTSNDGLIRASAGGTLALSVGAVNQTANGVLLATGSGSRVLLQNGAAVNGGTLTTASGGAFATAGVNSINNVTISSGSTFTGSNNTVTYLGGTITNQGTLLLNSGGNTTEFRIGAGSTTTLTGGGTVQLSNDPNNFIRDADAATGTLVNANNTIQGSGQLGFGQLHFVNQAGGTVIANQSNALTINTNGAGLTNDGTFQAATNRTLNVVGGPLSNFAGGTLTGGTYRADAGGTINLNTGPIVTDAAKIFLTGAGSALNTNSGATPIENSLTTIAAAGELHVLGGRNYTTTNALTNNGLVDLGGGTFTSRSLFNTATGTVSGFGVLTASDGSPLASVGAVVANGGTLTLTHGLFGSAGTATINAGAALDISGASGGNTVGTLAHNGTNLNLGGQNVTVSADYTNANFGVGNAFNNHAHVTGTGQILAAGNVGISISGAAVAGGTTATPTLALGNVHVGGTGGTTSFTINNTGTTGAVLRGAVQNGGITNGNLAVTAQNFGPIELGGSSAPQTVTYTPGAAGGLAGQSFRVVSNFDNVAAQTVGVTGAAYDLAHPVINTAQPVAFGNVHVGDAVPQQALSISNTVVTNAAFQEGLNASVTGTTGGVTSNGGTFNLLAAGQTNSSAIALGINTATAGARSGTATLGFVSDGSGTSGLGQTTLPSQSVNVTGNVFRLAQANTIAGIAFGNVHQGDAASQALSVSNLAANDGFSERLNASFGGTSDARIHTSGSISLLGAGATNNTGLVVSLDTSNTGTINGTATVHLQSDGNGTSGLGVTSLADQTPGVTAMITSGGNVFGLAQAGPHSPEPVNFGNVRIGTAQSQTLSIQNTAPNDGFHEKLDGQIGSATGAATTNAGSFTLLAPQATDSTSLAVGLNTSVAGARSGTATIALQSDGMGTSGLGITPLPSQTVNVQGNVYRLANPTLNTPAVTLAARVGDASPMAAVSVTNTSPDAFTEGLKANLGAAPAGFTTSGSIANLVAGGTDASSLRVGLSTGTSGTFSGMAPVAFTSTGAGTTGAADLALPGGSVGVTGHVYQAAVASVSPGGVNFGIVHVGDTPAAQSITVANLAAGALADVITGGLNAVSGPFTNAGAANLGAGVAAGSSSTALKVGLNTGAAGVFSGTATLALASHDADLADLALATTPVTLNGQVNNFALSGFGKNSGAGAFGGGGASYTLDFGTITQGSGTELADLFAANAAIGPADLLAGSFMVTAGSGFGLSGFGPFSGLGAGQHFGGLDVSFMDGMLGTFSETVELLGTGSNASGYSGAVAPIFLTFDGTVAPSGSGGGTNVPEPRSLGLLATAIALLAGARWARRTAAHGERA